MLVVPAGYVFANKLEQPLSYNAIIKANKNNPFMKIEDAKCVNGLVDFLKANGCYTTDESKFVLCGTQGEFWDVKQEKLVFSDTLMNGKHIDLGDIPVGKWFVVKVAAEYRPSSVGIQLPIKFLGIYQTSCATLRVNDTNSSGHGSGDILVAPKLPNGMPDYTNINPINNAVFALTYNQNVGGWSRSKCILPESKINNISINSLPKFTDSNSRKIDPKVAKDIITSVITDVYNRTHIEYEAERMDEEFGLWVNLIGFKKVDGVHPYYGVLYDDVKNKFILDVRFDDSSNVKYFEMKDKRGVEKYLVNLINKYANK